MLKEKEFDAFDFIRIRIFGPNRIFDGTVQMHVTLFSFDTISTEKKIEVVEKLLAIYGSESRDPYLELFEREAIEEGGFWTGFSWTFNKEHGIYQFDDGETISYQVEVNDFEDEEGFKVFILAYNQLVTCFGSI